jgi:hypothetical protein
MVEGEPKRELEQRGYKSQNYREISADYIFGGIKPGYIEMTVISTKIAAFEKIFDQKDVLEHTEEATLKITPSQAKSIVIWMLQNIKLYESTFGKIASFETDATKIEISKKVDDLLARL